MTGGIRTSVIVTCPFWGPGFTFYTTDKTVGVKSVPWVLLDSLCVPALAGPSGWEWKGWARGVVLGGDTQVLRTSKDLWSCILVTYFRLHPFSFSTRVDASCQGGTFFTKMRASPSICFLTCLHVNKQSDFLFLHSPGLPNDCVVWRARCQEYLQIWGHLSESQAGKHHEFTLVTISCGLSPRTLFSPPSSIGTLH